MSYFSLAAAYKNISIELIIDKQIPKELNSDDNRLKQVIISLLSNAIKFTNKGVITISADLYSIDIIKISIADTGCGIS